MNINTEYCLKYCSICHHQKIDFQQGIVCGLTDKKPNFHETCDHFVKAEHKTEKDGQKYLKNVVKSQMVGASTRFVHSFIDPIVVGMLITGILQFIPNSIANALFNQLNIIDLYLLIYGAILGYYILMEGFLGKTVAKALSKTKVVDMEGNHPGWSKIIIRSLCRLIPFNALSFLGSDASGWHNKISGTRVVHDYEN
ncbi:RDD family protein [Microscilla marina]|uniref:RDD family protein n=1 Tax=Microscilla marina ATCC 23134 TaxID=313606 RepID=A1ZUH0_MICM2|nr:RDD family protein [Microscilla marina]EAY25989.1 RDD family protein [Microscilla marina ATCC 23134]